MIEPGYEKLLTMEAFTTHPELWKVEKIAEHKKETQELQKLLDKKPETMIRPEKNRLVVFYRAQDYTIEDICKKVELSKPTVINIIRKYATDISKMKQLELEDLLHLHYQTTRRKVEMLGGMLGKLLEEFQRRSLEDVPTDKLLDIILKFNKTLSDLVAEKIIAAPIKEKEFNEATVI